MDKKVEVFWRIVVDDYEAQPEKWQSVFGEVQPISLIPHTLLCALDHGVRSDFRIKQNGNKAQFGFRPEGAKNVRILTAKGIKTLMQRYGYRRSHKPDRILQAMRAR